MSNILLVYTSLHVQLTATNLLMNYIALVPGVPTRMHWTDDYYVDRDITDKDTGKPKRVKTLVFWCDELNGEPVAKTFSVLSQKFEQHLKPWLRNKRYRGYDLIITEMGAGYYKDWNIKPILRPETD